MSDRSRKFSVTSWNVKEHPDEKYPGLRYLVYQLEKCPETGRLHWQAYCEFENTQRYAAVKKLFNDETAHISIPKGNAEQNKTYCTKENTRVEGPWEYGKPKTQGERSDLQKLASDVTDVKKTITDTMLEYPEMTIKYPRGITTLRMAALLKAGREFRDVEVVVLIGEPGVGKTKAIYDRYKAEEVYKLTASTQTVWFDHYDGEKILLIDDFKGWIPYTYLLNLLDKYPVSLPVKGGHTYALWTKVYITSNYTIEQWYNFTLFKKEALERRIKDIKYLSSDE